MASSDSQEITKATVAQAIKALPYPQLIPDPPTQRFLEGVFQILSHLGLALETEKESAPVQVNFRARNIGRGAEVYAGGGVNAMFRTLAGVEGITVQEEGDLLIFRLAPQDAPPNNDRLVAADAEDSEPGTLDAKLVDVGDDAGAVDVLDGVTNGQLGVRRLVGDGAYMKLEVTEDGGIQIAFNGIDVAGYDAGNSQVFGHASGAPTLYDIVTAMDAASTDGEIPTAKTVFDALAAAPAAATATAQSLVTAFQITAAGLLQVKTRVLTAPDAWWAAESAWTTVHTPETLACP